MKDDTDKTIKTTYTYKTSHVEKLRKMSKETYTPVSGLIRKALDEFFERYEKN
jgi:predicted transcriptional regulator